jgi:hypothetical protein
MLKSLGEERFLTLLANWHRGVHGKFKVPVFAHRELDLYKVFWSVMDKGGYEVVSSNKQWKVRKPLRLVKSCIALIARMDGILHCDMAAIAAHALSMSRVFAWCRRSARV